MNGGRLHIQAPNHQQSNSTKHQSNTNTQSIDRFYNNIQSNSEIPTN